MRTRTGVWLSSQMERVLLAQISSKRNRFGERSVVGVGIAHTDEPSMKTVWLRALPTHYGTPRLGQRPRDRS